MPDFTLSAGVTAHRDGHVVELVSAGATGGIKLPAGVYEAYVQSGRWSQESQGRWVPLHAGTLLLHGTAGRTAQGATPFAAIRQAGGAGKCLVLHLLPRGEWELRLRVEPGMHGVGGLDVEWGYAGRRSMAPAAVVVDSEDSPEAAAPHVHQWWLRRYGNGGAPRSAPVCYNTWLDQFDNLDLPRLRTQLAAAVEVGCEVFVVDAGWFGGGGGDWFESVGDWEESGVVDLRGWADEVRRSGLGFGLWMEPEHVGPRARVRVEHPEYFAGGPESPRLDLENPSARSWLWESMTRLIERYGLAWLKVDFNIGLGDDATARGLTGYYDAWYGILDDLRRAFPGMWLEGCASGGMRLELESLRHFDGHFLSDNTNAYEVIRLGEGTMLRCPPGRLGRWCVVRGMGRVAPEYPDRASASPDWTATSVASGWQSGQGPEWVDPGLAVLACVPGQLGLSGDLAGLAAPTRDVLAKGVAWFKAHRAWLTDSHAHLLTPVREVDDRKGWSAVQLSRADRDEHMVCVYRLQDPRAEWRVRLRGLVAGTRYRWTSFRGDSGEASGEKLMREGLGVSLPKPGRAESFSLRVRK